MGDLVLATTWGLLIGGINHLITRRALKQAAAAGDDAAQAQQAIRRVQGAFLIRMLVSLAGLTAAFLAWRGDTLPVGIAAAALLLVNILSPWHNHRRRRGA
ncbi:MAG TPA: hypothetical protein VF282_00550 [Bacillota bacterium]